VYGAPARGRINAVRLREELVRARDRSWPPVFAVDASTWCRNDAECSAGRGYYYHPSRHSAGQPIVAGWSYQRIAQLGRAADSWTAPVDAVRLDPRSEAPEQAAAGQIRDLLGRLDPTGAVPWFVFDGGYDPVQLTVALAGTRVQTLTRIKSNRIFHRAPPPRPPGRSGAPRRHGAKFRCAEPATWPEPDQVLITSDVQYGTVRVPAWHGPHPPQRTYRDENGALSIVPGTVLRVQVEHLPGRIDRAAKALWLWWDAPAGTICDLDIAWRALRSKVRPGPHLPLRQAGPGLDHPQGPHPRTGRPLDLAGHRRLHPTAPRPAPRRGPPAALAAAPAGRQAHTRPGPPGLRPPPRTDGQPGQATETPWTPTRTPPRTSLRPCTPLSRHQKAGLTGKLPQHAHTASRRGHPLAADDPAEQRP
jgi:hypothetical protein